MLISRRSLSALGAVIISKHMLAGKVQCAIARHAPEPTEALTKSTRMKENDRDSCKQSLCARLNLPIGKSWSLS